MPQKKVLGLGAAAMDVVLKCRSLPREDGFSFVHYEKLMSGGSCANMLVTLAKLGTPASLVAAVGDDHYGAVFLDELARDGVETENVRVRPAGTTLHTFITVDDCGARSIFVNTGNCLLTLSETEVNARMLEGTAVFYTDMFPAEPALKLARLARERNIPVVFVLECTPSFMELCGTGKQHLKEMLDCCQLFCASREALLEFAAADDPFKAAAELYRIYKPPLGLVATIGDAGALWIDRDRTIHTGAFAVEAEDTTGAGDAFVGGLIHSFLMQRQGKEEAMRFAAVCAALKCTRLGARFQFGEEQVKEFLAEKKKT